MYAHLFLSYGYLDLIHDLLWINISNGQLNSLTFLTEAKPVVEEIRI